MVLIVVYQTHKFQPLVALAHQDQQEILLVAQELLELLVAQVAAGLEGIQMVLVRGNQALVLQVLLLLVVLVVAVRVGRVVKTGLQMAVLAVMLQQMALVVAVAVAVSPVVLAHNQAHTHQ
jgi:hypothetical protein